MFIEKINTGKNRTALAQQGGLSAEKTVPLQGNPLVKICVMP